MKKEVKLELYSFDTYTLSGLTIDKAIEKLAEIKKELTTKPPMTGIATTFIRFEFGTRDCNDYSCNCHHSFLRLFGIRLETDEEEKEREAKEQQEEKVRLEHRKKQYEAMKKEFEPPK